MAGDWFAKQPVGLPGTGLWLGMAKLAFALLWVNGVICVAAAAFASAGCLVLMQLAVVRAPALTLAVTAMLTAVSLMVPLSAAYSRTHYSAGLVDLAMRFDDIKPYKIRIDAVLTVHGVPVSLTRIIECRRPNSLREASQADNRRFGADYRFPSLKSFGQVLSDGSGVFLITPDTCERIARKELPIPSGYIPLIGWSPNARTLDSFDFYYSGRALRQAANAVVFHSITAELASDTTPADAPDEFGVFGWEYYWTTGTEYGAYLALKVPEEDWQRHDRAASFLLTQEDFGYALPDSSSRTDKGWNVYSGLHEDNVHFELERNGQTLPKRTANGTLVPVADPKSAFVPMRRDGSGWRLEPELTGVITYYRGLPTSLAHVDLPETVILGSNVAVRPHGHPGSYVFDPATRTLFAVGYHHFQLAEPDTVFASR